MEREIVIIPSVILFLKNLVDILYEEEYFGFEEDAHEYVDWLKSAILRELPDKTHHRTPAELSHYGTSYIKIKSNKRTVWYVFYDEMNGRFLVQFITNNHTPQSSFFKHL